MVNKFLKPFLLVMGVATSELWVANLLECMRRSSEELYNHSVFVALITANLALYGDTDMMDEFGNDVNSLIIGALLHDVGYICNMGIAIHKHREEMSDFELEIFRNHIENGYGTVSKYTDKQIILDIVEMHHEYIDGTGFPKGLKGDDLPPYVKLVSISNAFASYMTRSMNNGLSFTAIMNDIEAAMTDDSRNGRYDIEAVSIFFENLTDVFSYMEPVMQHLLDEKTISMVEDTIF